MKLKFGDIKYDYVTTFANSSDNTNKLFWSTILKTACDLLVKHVSN